MFSTNETPCNFNIAFVIMKLGNNILYYYIILYYIILYYIISYYVILYYILLHYLTLYINKLVVIIIEFNIHLM